MGWLPNSPIKSLFCGVWLEVAALCEIETVHVYFFTGSPSWFLQRNIMIVQAYLHRLLCTLHIQLIFNGYIRYLVSRRSCSWMYSRAVWRYSELKVWAFEVSTTSPKGFSQYTLYQSEMSVTKKNEDRLSCQPGNIFIYFKFVLLIWILVTQFSYTPGCFSRDLMGKPQLTSKLTQHCDVRKKAQQANLNKMVGHLKLFSS